MKRKIMKQLIAMMLTIAMVMGVIPGTALTVSATGKAGITNISLSFSSENDIPQIGTPVTYRSVGAIQESDDRISLTGSSLLWKDENGKIINDTTKNTGYNFEAGRTYYADIVAALTDSNAYQFTENANITLTNPGEFSYTGKIIEIQNLTNNQYATIRLTITMNGKRTYPALTKVVFEDTNAPTEGSGLVYADLFYNNCKKTSDVWYEQNNVWATGFVGGKTYTRIIVLEANDGYKFSANTDVQLSYGGVVQQPTRKELSQNDTILTLTYSYTIKGREYINNVDVTLKRYYEKLTPITGEEAAYILKDSFVVNEDAPYEAIRVSYYRWFDENDKQLSANDYFEVGKTYYFEISFHIKDEYEETYLFDLDNVKTSINGDSYTGRGFEKYVLQKEDSDYATNGSYVKFRYYFTCQFPEGKGNSRENPVVCSTFNEFKCAMEDENIKYVSLGNVDEVLPEKKGNEAIAAISVKGTKNLYLLDDASFTAPVNGKLYDCLLKTENGSELIVQGGGTLRFRAVGTASSNAVIRNAGGKVTISNCLLIGYYNTATYGMAIWQDYGELNIYSGIISSYSGEESVKTSDCTYPLYIMNGTAKIYSGNFYADGLHYKSDQTYGISIGKNANVTIYGGKFQGIQLPSGTRVSNYIADGCVMSYNGVIANAANYHTIPGSKTIEIYKEISKVEIHINSPVAGKYISTDVYNVPEGSYVHAVNWYEDGKLIMNSQKFTAGKTYKVEIYLMTEEDTKFKNPLTKATVNYKSTNILTPGNKPEEAIGFSVDFGKCPDTVSLVELTVTAPKEGNTTSYTIGCANDTYYAVGGSSNYTEYRQWYMSSDNDDWWEVGKTHKFMSGYYYKLYVDIHVKNGYEFPVYDNGSSIQPDVSATVNGNYANVFKAYEQDPSEYITVEYNFGECNDSVIENITVVDVVEPVAGEYPTYSYNILGTGYHKYTTKNAYDDAYWLTPAEKWYYIRNGIGWFDYTDRDWVYENEKFIAGHEYQAVLYLNADDGYEFYHDKRYDMLISATVNGNEATFKNTGSSCATSQEIGGMFICKEGDNPEVTTPTEYAVVYLPGEGSGSMSSASVNKYGTYTLADCSFEAPEGYKFKAWAIGSVNGEQKQPGDKITITEDTFICALWEIDENAPKPTAELKISGASLTLQDNLTINYMVKASLFTDTGYKNPYMKFILNGKETIVSDYVESGDNYVFSFKNIAPNQMNDMITATVYAKYGGIEYKSASRDYGVITYCNNMLSKSTSAQGELRTLLVDLLNYGAQSQLYTGYKTGSLVNASLTATQKSWGTQKDRTWTTVQDIAYKTISNPSVTWKGAGLMLTDRVEIRLSIAASDISNLKVKAELADGTYWYIPASSFEADVNYAGRYNVDFNGLNSGQMSEPVYFTVYRGNTVVSNTVRYSVESYAYAQAHKSAPDQSLLALLKVMMKYGDSAYNYVH